jgi:hypothetical protein
MFNAALAIELLAVCDFVEGRRGRQFDSVPNPATNFIEPARSAQPLEVAGSPLRNPVGLVSREWKSDAECMVACTDTGAAVVAFRSSEPPGFQANGGFKDWVTTDLRANRIPYPPEPGGLLGVADRRWVHAGFWQAYERVRQRLLNQVHELERRHGRLPRIYVTGFSLGGALATLAALDLAQQHRKTPVMLYALAAPRVGDSSLMKLVSQRLREAFGLGYGGDPIVHLPPFGPNVPITFTHLAKINLAGIHVPLGNPGIPQILQQYRSLERSIYIDTDHQLHEGWPPLQVAVNVFHHDLRVYLHALKAVLQAREETRAARRAKGLDAVLAQLLLAPRP